MGWRQFRRWLAAMDAEQLREIERRQSNPHTWDGSEHDPWWRRVRAEREANR